MSSLRIAFASSDRRHVDQHFGAALAFAIYALSREGAHLEEVAEFSPQAMDGNEDKLAPKIALLEGCAAMYCQAVGASAMQQLLARGIHPQKVEAGTTINSILEQLRAELRSEARGWLAKAIARSEQPRDARRFEFMAEEDWQE
ncbi:MAG: NifB/NifX family molybdenum-iron cluster-binding protein [Pseudomonadota bacterium]